MKTKENTTWISVDSALPDAGQYIIYHAPGIFNSMYSAQAWIGKCDVHGKAFYSTYGFFGGGEVTHWTHIPPIEQFTRTEESKPSTDRWVIYCAPGMKNEVPLNLYIGQYDAEEDMFYNRRSYFQAADVSCWIALPEIPEYVERDV